MALGCQKSSALLIVFYLIHVLSAVYFDDEFGFRRAEVGNIRTDTVLPAKVHGTQLISAQIGPQLSLGGSHLFAQLERTLITGRCSATERHAVILSRTSASPRSPSPKCQVDHLGLKIVRWAFGGGRVGVAHTAPSHGSGRCSLLLS